MRQVPEPEGAQRIGRREIEDLLAHVPGVTVPPDRGVLLREGGLGRDVAVQVVVGERPQQVGDGGGQLVQVRQHRLAEVDVRARRPGVGYGREQRDARQRRRRRGRQAPGAQCFLRRLMAGRPQSSTARPRRTFRSVAATSSVVVSTSSWTTSNRASRSARRVSAASAAFTIRPRSSRDVPTRLSASVRIVATSWRTSLTAGPARCSRIRRNVRKASTAMTDDRAIAIAASARIASEIPVTTATQDGIMLDQSSGALAVSSGRAGAGVNGAGPARTASRIRGGAPKCASTTPGTSVVNPAPPAFIFSDRPPYMRK